MLDIAWTELIIIAIVAILVVGPRELPRMLRGLGTFMGQMRRMAGDFQRQFNDALKETELDEVKRGFESARKANPINKLKDDLNPLKGAGESVRKAVEDPGAPKTGGKAEAKPSAESGGAGKAARASAAKSDAPAKTAATARKSGVSAKTAATGKSGASPARKTAAASKSSRGAKTSKTTKASKTPRTAKPTKAEADGGDGASD